MNKRQLCGTLLLSATFLILAAAPAARAQSGSDKSIRLTVGFPPGTAPDVLARVVSDKLTQQSGQTVVVDNKPGAGGQIAAQHVAKGSPDGFNLLLAEPGSISIAPAAFSKLTYDPSREFVAVAELAWADFVLVVPASSAHASLSTMVQAGKAASGGANFGTFGAGTPGHFAAVELGRLAGFKVEPVHYRNTGELVTAVVAGDVAGAWVSAPVAATQVKGGKLRGLATTGTARSALLPDVATAGELGFPGLNLSGWLAVLAPASAPAAVIERHGKAFVAAVQDPDVRKKLIEAGFVPTGAGPVETDKMLKAQSQRWSNVVQAAGFRAD